MSKLLEQFPRQLTERGIYGIFSDFVTPPVKRIENYLVAGLTADSDLTVVGIFSPGQAIQVWDVQFTGNVNSSGIAAGSGNNSVWVVANEGNAMVTATYDDDPAFPLEDVATSLGTIELGQVAATGWIDLTITNGTNAATPAGMLTILYSNLTGYPEQGWSVHASDGGVVTITEGVRGEAKLTPSDSTDIDNDEIYLASELEQFKFLVNKPAIFEARVKFTATAIGTTNVIVGFKDAVGANTLQDDGAGPPDSYSGACLVHLDGGTYWVCESSVGATQTTVTTDKTVVDDTYATFRITVNPISSTQAEVHFFFGSSGNALQEVGLTTVVKQFVAHKVLFSGATEMQICLGIKDGASANAASLTVDYAGMWQER